MYKNICEKCGKPLFAENVIIEMSDIEKLRNRSNKETQTVNYIIKGSGEHYEPNTCYDYVYIVVSKIITFMVCVIVCFVFAFIMWIFTGMLLEA